MIVVDVNVLVAAHLADHPHHESALSYLSAALAEDTVLVPDVVWSGFLRIVTNSRVFTRPSSIREAVGFVRAVESAGGYRHVPGLVDGLGPLLRIVVDNDASANLVPDAYIAAVAVSHSCAVATFDRDFRRFDGLEVVELPR